MTGTKKPLAHSSRPPEWWDGGPDFVVNGHPVHVETRSPFQEFIDKGLCVKKDDEAMAEGGRE